MMEGRLKERMEVRAFARTVGEFTSTGTLP